MVWVASLIVALMLLSTWMPRTAHAATIVVDTTDAGTVTNSECSLVEAIIAANTNSAVDTCPAGDDTPVDTLVLGSNLTYTLPMSYATYLEPVGLPSITSTIVMSGNDATIVRESSEQFGLLYVDDSGDLTLHDLTLRNGHAITNGGALANEGTLTLINSAAISNAATYGGAIATISGTTTLSNTQVLSNAAQYGGGLYSLASEVALAGAQVNYNLSATATGYGGGIFNQDSTVTLTATQVISNVAGEYESYGGGIYNDRTTITVTNSTIRGNEASGLADVDEGGNGGGLYSKHQSVVKIAGSDIDHNKANFGGGIYTEQSTLTVNNSDLSSNYAWSFGTSPDSGYGAGLYSKASTVAVNESHITLNIAERPGGGIFNTAGTITISATHILTNTGVGNQMGRDGGGISNGDDGQVTIINSHVISNRGGGDAGAIENHGVMTITGTTIAMNSRSGTQGAGVLNGGVLTITHSLLLSNTANSPSGEGSAVYQEDGSTYVAQSCIVGNAGVAVAAAENTDAVDARNNWWGAPDGPSGEGPGSGDSVDGNVLFSPFLTSPILNCPATTFLGVGVTKSANTSNAIVGQTITYTYQLVNNGHLTLTTISATDDKFGALAGLAGALAPFASRSVTLTYVVQESDLPGPLVNTVVVTGTDSMGHTMADADAASVNLTTSKFAATVEADRAYVPLDGTILYTYRITNTGPVSVTIHRASADRTGALDDLEGPLAPGATRSVSRSYIVSASHLPGPVVNSLVVTGTDTVSNTLVRNGANSTLISIGDGSPAFVLLLTTNKSFVKVGNTVLYTYRVVNTGANAFTISSAVDNHLGVINELVGTLAAGATRIATISYVVQEGDMPGPIDNEIVVTVTRSGDSNVGSASATVNLGDFIQVLPYVRR